MPRVCITGGGGYFGQRVAYEFLEQGYDANLLDINFEAPPPGIMLDQKKIKIFKGSILDRKLVENALVNCETCVHIAAYGMGGKGACNKKLVFATNVDGTNLVMDICRENGVKRFINSSSVGVIFTDHELNMVDESYPYPGTFYSYYCQSKAIAEKAVKKANSENFSTVSLRYRGIFGPGEPRTTARAAETIHRGLYFARFEHNTPAMTQFSGLDNTAKACWLAEVALRDRKEIVGGKVYNIVDGGPPVPSWDFWIPLCQALNRSRPWLVLPFWMVFYLAWASEFLCENFGITPLFLRLEVALVGFTNTYSIEAARRDLGYDPQNNHDLKETAAYYKRHYAENPSWRIDWSFLLAVTVLFLMSFLLTFVW